MLSAIEDEKEEYDDPEVAPSEAAAITVVL